MMSIEKPKITQHPQWEPYAFPELDFAMTKDQEQKSEYAKFRLWLIEKVSVKEFDWFFLFIHTFAFIRPHLLILSLKITN